jgi:hypothetical protein
VGRHDYQVVLEAPDHVHDGIDGYRARVANLNGRYPPLTELPTDGTEVFPGSNVDQQRRFFNRSQQLLR